MRRLSLLLGILLCTIPVFAGPTPEPSFHERYPDIFMSPQITNPPIVFQNQGTVLGVSFTFNCSTGMSCSFVNGVMTATSTGGGGSGTVSGQASGVIPLGTNATTIGAQSHCDDGNTTAGTITCSEPIVSTKSISTGSPCTPAGATAVGGVCATESAVTGWTSTAGFDYMRADSTGHDWLCGINGAADGNCTFGALTAATFTSNGTTAGFADFPQGTTSVAAALCATATSICEQAPTAVTSYLVTKPGVSATGIITNNVAAAVITQGFSGDANHSATVTTGSGASIGSTQLCSAANCPAGTYLVNVYIDITTACTTTGTYTVNLIYTDDQGAKTVPVNINGTGAVPATGVLTLSSTANFGENAQVIRVTSGATNYSTTAGACGTGGPMVGKLYLAAVPVM